MTITHLNLEGLIQKEASATSTTGLSLLTLVLVKQFILTMNTVWEKVKNSAKYSKKKGPFLQEKWHVSGAMWQYS